jgi:maleylpyruvate isomerase
MILHSATGGRARPTATRIALNLKGLEYDQRDVDLRQKAHRRSDFVAINPQGMVPALEVDGAS